MQLKYRGTNYDLNTPVLGIRNSNPASTTLKYRGNLYTTNMPTVDVSVPVVVAPLTETITAPVAQTLNDRARVLMMNHHRQVKRRQQVMLNRVATSIGLDTTRTSQYWNHIQGKVHPSFWATYDRSQAASS